MGTNTGIGIGIGIPFKNNALGGDRPYLPPELKARLIGVWDNYGKKNTDTDRNIIKNKIPNAGGDLEILNAAYKLNSGFGKYETELSDTRIWTQSKEITSSPFSSSYNGLSGWIIFANTSLTNSADMPSFKIQVKGLLEGQELIYRYYDSNGQSNVYSMGKDGEYTLPSDVRTAKPQTSNTSGFQVVKNDTNTITITQIPQFEGAFVTDGINDLITSTKTVQEMLGGSNECTVISMIANLDSRQILCNSNFSNANGYNVRNTLEPNGVISMLGYTDKNGTTNNLNLIMGDKDSIKLTDKVNFNSDYVFYPAQYYKVYYQVAWYWTIIANKVLTTDEINQVIAYYNLDRTLKPDILCNIGKQGITNDNHADFNDKLIDYSGNGRDIQMYNLAWKGGSGVAAKQYETFKDWTRESSSTSIIKQIDEFTRIVESTTNGYWVSRIRRDSDLDKVYSPINVYLYQDNNFLVHECKYEVDGVKYAIPINEPVGKGYHKLEIYTKDRYTELPENAENIVLSEWYFPKSTKGSIKYSLIPSCKGGILLDGINDFGKVTGMPIYKDYTVVTDREIFANTGAISSKNSPGAFVETGGNTVYSFGQGTSSLKFISTRSISYLSKYSYCGQSITAGAAEDGTDMWLGTIRDGDSRFFKGAIYSLMSFPYSISKFLIERQLKKHKLGTLYPDMVEFRPVIKSSVELVNKPTFVIRGSSTLLNAGDYIAENSELWAVITMNNAADRITKFVINGNTINIPSSAYNPSTMKYGFPFTIDSKSPQKINLTIEQDENYVKFEPIITANANYRINYYLISNNAWNSIKTGDYVTIGSNLGFQIIFDNDASELKEFVSSQLSDIVIQKRPSASGYNIYSTINSESPQNINITIDEYIRYEDIVQPYPVFVGLSGATWGSKLKVGSTVSYIGLTNLLVDLYGVRGTLLFNGVPFNKNSGQHKVEKNNALSFTENFVWLKGSNEPKVILSPSRLRIPNSSYKLLGYIPDISGHGNHGVIHNSAYAEGSGVNEDGSYQFDGVDDFVTIPTTVGGKQVLMKVNWQSEVGGVTLYDQRLNLSDYEFAIYNGNRDLDDNPVMAYQGRNNGQTYVDGILNSNIKASELKAITHNITTTNELSLGTNNTYPVIGSTRSNTHFAQMSLYDFMLFDEISTDGKIKELNEYVGIEAKVEKPDYYWDAYGKTNLDGDRATIQQRGTAVGDYDLTNYNHAYEGMSGYNGYPVVFGNNKAWESILAGSSYTADVTSTTIHLTHVERAGRGLLASYVKRDGALANIKEIPAFRVTIKGLEGNSKVGYRYLATEDATEETLVYLGNGTHELAKSFTPTEALLDLNRDAWIGMLITPMIEGEVVFDCDITIEVLPEYENGLVYDGVTDYSENANIPILNDFTFLVKGSLLKGFTGSGGCIARKGDIEHVTNGGYAFVYCLDSSTTVVNRNSYWSFGKELTPSTGAVDPPLIGYMTKTSVNGVTTTFGTNPDVKGIIFGNWGSGYMNMVIYKSILYSKTISLLEINFLKNLMEKDEIIDINHPIFISNTEDESNTSQDA